MIDEGFIDACQGAGGRKGVILGLLHGDLVDMFSYQHEVTVWVDLMRSKLEQENVFAHCKKARRIILPIKAASNFYVASIPDRFVDSVLLASVDSFQSLMFEVNSWIPKMDNGAFIMPRNEHSERFVRENPQYESAAYGTWQVIWIKS